METLNNYNFRGYDFTVWFFRILLCMAGIMVVLLFAMRISETVTVTEGEILSDSPQADYKAPFDGQAETISVKEGQAVNKGDTLMIIANLEIRALYSKALTEVEYLKKKMQSISVLQEAVQKKKAAVEQSMSLAASRYQVDIDRLVGDMKSLDQQYQLQQDRLAAAREKYEGDSILYAKDMLSKYEFNSTKDDNLALRENISVMQNQRDNRLSERQLAYNNFTREKNTLLLSKVQLEENEQDLVLAMNDHESQLLQAEANLRNLHAEMQKQYVIASSSGIVNHVFNTKQTSNLIVKNDLLLSLSPRAGTYYAKVFLDEKDIPYIKSGLAARLKLNAYQQLNEGPIQGQVSYVAERKESERFYALVRFAEDSSVKLKPGYKVTGKIVVDRMPLGRFLIKKLFKKLDSA